MSQCLQLFTQFVTARLLFIASASHTMRRHRFTTHSSPACPLLISLQKCVCYMLFFFLHELRSMLIATTPSCLACLCAPREVRVITFASVARDSCRLCLCILLF